VQHSKRLTILFSARFLARRSDLLRGRASFLPDFMAEIWKSVAPDNHLGSFIELVGGAGNSATITLPDGLYVMFWDHPMHLSIGAERSKQ
jgi:hypothetical protein